MRSHPAAPTPAQAIGIDIGGTKIAGGLVDVGTGALSHRIEIPTHAARGGQAVLADVLALVQQLQHECAQPVVAIGLGICELVSPDGAVQSGHTIAWQGLPVQATLSRIAPSVVEADVRAHALAEATFGAGAGYPSFVFVTVGTGISSCLVQAGRPWPGEHGNALVMATAPLELPNERDVVHPFVLEEYASGLALLARYAAATGVTLAHGRELFERAAQGDDTARHILQSAGAALGSTIGLLVNVLDPAAVVIGGGLGLAGGPYWASMVPAIRRAIYADATRGLPIVQASLGADAGVIGAALAGFQRTTRPVGAAGEG